MVEKVLNIGKDKSGKAFALPVDALKKHLIVFGGSGSGKTVLSKVVVEECYKKKIPSIILDPQGDLASLALPSELKAKVVVFTPTSSKGVPVCVCPLKMPHKDLAKEEFISISNQVANSITKLLGYKDDDKGKAASSLLYLVINDYWSKGKSINDFEQLSNILQNLQGNLKSEASTLLGSEKELQSLVRKIKYLTIGEKKLLFNFGVPLDINTLLGKNKDQISVIYLNSLHSQSEKDFFVSMLATDLYKWMLAHPSNNVQALFFIDEIAPYLPAGSLKPLSKPILNLIYKQARKYGVSCLVSTQNPGDIDYKSFAQFGTWAIGRLTTVQDRKKVFDGIKSIAGPRANEFQTLMPGLKTGEFLFFNPDYLTGIKEVKVRQTITEHKTLTEEDVKALTSKDIKDKFETVESKQIVSEAKGVLHFPVKITEAKFENYKKRRFKFFGAAVENIEDSSLVFEPLMRVHIRSKASGFFKKSFKEFNVLFNGLTGDIVDSNRNVIVSFSLLLGLNDSDISVFKVLAKSKEDVSVEQISSATGLSDSQINTSLKALLDKGLSGRTDKQGNAYLWTSMVKFKDASLKNCSPGKLVLNDKKLDVKQESPKFSIEEVKRLVNIWFGSAEVIGYELVYYPVWDVVFSSKKGKRTVKVSAVTGKPI